MEDTASLSYCEAWPLGNRALLGENYLLHLVPLAYYIFSVKKNDVTQPRETQRPGDKGGDDGFIVFSVPSRDVGRTQELAVLTMLLGNVQPGLTVAGGRDTTEGPCWGMVPYRFTWSIFWLEGEPGHLVAPFLV